MGDKNTIVNIQTRYDGRGAAAAKQDVQSIAGTSSAGMKAESQAADQLKQKADALGSSTKELSKAKIALNATTLVLRGSFREAAQQLDKLGGAWKVFAGTVASTLAVVGALIAVFTVLVNKWKEHKAAVAEADKQLKALNWSRLQESLDLTFDKGRKALDEWVEALQKTETQAKATAAAILLVNTAQKDAEMARIDLKESKGELSKNEAQQQRNSLMRSRDLESVERDRLAALRDTAVQQDVVYDSSSNIKSLTGAQEADMKSAETVIQDLQDKGIIDNGGVDDFNRIIERGGTVDQARFEQIKKMAGDAAKKRAADESYAYANKKLEENPMLAEYDAIGGLRKTEEARLYNQYNKEAISGIDNAVNVAVQAGQSTRTSREQLPVLQRQMDQAKQKLEYNRATLEAAPIKRQAIEDKYAALDIPLRAQDPSFIASSAKDALVNGGVMEFPGRRDNAGQIVPGGGAAQASRAQQLVQRAQELVVGGADDAAVAERLAQLLNQLGAKIKTDKQSFYNLVDQLDGIAGEIGDLKAREKANKAGE